MKMKTLASTLLHHHTGAPMVMLGGDVWEQRVTGDIVSEFKWVGGEPVMLIYKRVLGKNTPAYMIELADAHKFALSNGGPSKALLEEYCHDAAKAIGAENDRSTIIRLIDVILNGLADLLMMPPEPKHLEDANKPSSGNDELTIKLDGRTIVEVQV